VHRAVKKNNEMKLVLGGRRAFAIAGPTAWKSLSDDLRHPTLSTDSFRRLLIGDINVR